MNTKQNYENCKQQLIDLLFSNTKFAIEPQYENDQIVVWCKTFDKDWNICFQNGNASGQYKGKAVWTNPGANDGIDALVEILKNHKDFVHLTEPNEYWKYEYLKELINDFIQEYVKRENINQFFAEKEA